MRCTLALTTVALAGLTAALPHRAHGYGNRQCTTKGRQTITSVQYVTATSTVVAGATPAPVLSENDNDKEGEDYTKNYPNEDEEEDEDEDEEESKEEPEEATPSTLPAPISSPNEAAPSRAPAAPAATPITSTPSTSASGLWQPAVGTTWQIVLGAAIDPSNLTPNVDVYDIDLFDTDAATIATLHDKQKKVICYFSAGSWEPNRADSDKFASSELGVIMQGWESEKWLDVRSANVLSIMKGRIDLAKEKGCDGIDPDNMDGYSQDYNIGFDFTADDSATYLKAMASYAAEKGISTGLKNSADIVSKTVGFTQFSVNEQCHEYSECASWQPFIDAGKPVFNIEYPSEAPATLSVSALVEQGSAPCSDDNGGASRFSTVVKTMDLDGWVQLCHSDYSVATTNTYN